MQKKQLRNFSTECNIKKQYTKVIKTPGSYARLVGSNSSSATELGQTI